VKKGVIKGRGERNRILAEMTEEVADLVLADNARQAIALSLDGLRSARRYEEFLAYIDDLVGAGVLNRVDESIPDRDELLASPHRERGLPRPLLAVLLGYTKMFAFPLVMETDFPDGEAGRPFLDNYFPHRLRREFGSHFAEHVLRREIVATGAVNYLVNKAGVTFLSRMMAATKAGLGEVVTAYVDVDREAEGGRLRLDILAAGLAARAEQDALLVMEDAIEVAVEARLEGRKASAPKKALADLRAQLKL
jgi:glutamate dehydrogenase